MPDGNDAQIRAVAQTLFDTWKANQEHEAQAKELESKRRAFSGSLPAWVTCGLSILGIVMLAGQTNQRVSDNSRRIDNLEVSDRDQTREAKAVGEKLSSIDAKLDLIINGDR